MPNIYIIYGSVIFLLVISCIFSLINWITHNNLSSQISCLEKVLHKNMRQLDQNKTEPHEFHGFNSDQDETAEKYISPEPDQQQDRAPGINADNGDTIQIVRNVRDPFSENPCTQNPTYSATSPGGDISPEEKNRGEDKTCVPDSEIPCEPNSALFEKQQPDKSPLSGDEISENPSFLSSHETDTCFHNLSADKPTPQNTTPESADITDSDKISSSDQLPQRIPKQEPELIHEASTEDSLSEEGILDVVDIVTEESAPLVIPLYSPASKDADFAFLTDRLKEVIRTESHTEIHLDFDQIYFLHTKEIEYLKKISKVNHKYNIQLLFINCDRELETQICSHPELSSLILGFS
ncbi:hypothetical protein CHISP_2088 [Chitinispirillum alkaliphilum]|nr:hypothetical protein CHISP_2088 [Chitinispirillum alkaliphilum]